MQDLYRMSKKLCKKGIIGKNFEEFKKYEKALKQNYPGEDVFSLEYLEKYEVKFKKHCLIQFKELILIM